MHEFSICERIVEAVLGELSDLRPAPKRLCKVRVVVGRLHQIVPDYLTFAYDLLTRDTAAAGSEMELVHVPVVGECRRCGWSGEIELPIFRCGDCGVFDVALLGGKELFLEQLEVELWKGSRGDDHAEAPPASRRAGLRDGNHARDPSRSD